MQFLVFVQQGAGQRDHAAFFEPPGAAFGHEFGGGEDLADVDGVDVHAERLEVEGPQEGDFGRDHGHVLWGLEGGVADALELGAELRDEAGDRKKLEQSAVGVWDGVSIHSVRGLDSVRFIVDYYGTCPKNILNLSGA